MEIAGRSALKTRRMILGENRSNVLASLNHCCLCLALAQSRCPVNAASVTVKNPVTNSNKRKAKEAACGIEDGAKRLRAQPANAVIGRRVIAQDRRGT